MAAFYKVHQVSLKSIRDEKALTDPTEEKLKKAIEEFLKTFE